MIPRTDPTGLEGRRRALERSFARYVELRDAGRRQEAVEQLRSTSRLAAESMEHTVHLVRQLLRRVERLNHRLDRERQGPPPPATRERPAE